MDTELHIPLVCLGTILGPLFKVAILKFAQYNGLATAQTSNYNMLRYQVIDRTTDHA